MTTLVTGATGFIGNNIVEALVAGAQRVVAFAVGGMPANALAEFARYGDALDIVEGDVRDSECLAKLFVSRRIERMVHGAVITAGVAREREDVTTIVDVNVTGTARVLETARHHGVGRIVHVSSGSAYGRSLFECERLFEDVTPERPQTMYQITKFAGERTALRLRELHGLDLVCVRLGSVIGPWERDTGVRDTLSTHFQLAKMAARGESVVLPQREFRRDWVYCRDVSSAISDLLYAPTLDHALYNISSDLAWGGLLPWCRKLQEIFPQFAYRVAGEQERTNLGIAEMQDRGVMDIGRLRRDIGYRPKFGPTQAYDDYAEWLRAYGSH